LIITDDRLRDETLPHLAVDLVGVGVGCDADEEDGLVLPEEDVASETPFPVEGDRGPLHERVAGGGAAAGRRKGQPGDCEDDEESREAESSHGVPPVVRIFGTRCEAMNS